MSKPVLQVVIASTRPGRVGPPIADWFAERARAHGAFEVEVLDLAEIGLPFLDEPHHPKLRQYVHDHTKAWSATIERGDAFVFVTPEYNHSFNAVLKNALDFLHVEWQYKGVGFVSYGGVSAGTRAVNALRQVTSTLKMMPVLDAVNIPFFPQFFDKEGRLAPNETMNKSADDMLQELVNVTSSLRPLKAPVTV